MNLTFAFIGDIGHYNTILKRNLQVIKNAGVTSRVVVLGDVFYPGGLNAPDDPRLQHYREVMNGLKCPINLILGNHDYLGEPKLYLKHRLWEMPNYYYRLCYPQVDLVLLDTQILEPAYTVNSKLSNVNTDIVSKRLDRPFEETQKEQLVWLEEALRQSTSQHLVVAGHYHLMSNGMYGANERLLKLLMPLFRRYKVQVYISGHEHNNQHHIIRDGDYTLHHFIIGSSAGSRAHFQQRSPAYFSKDPCHLQLKVFPSFMLFRFINFNGKIIHNVKINRISNMEREQQKKANAMALQIEETGSQVLEQKETESQNSQSSQSSQSSQNSQNSQSTVKRVSRLVNRVAPILQKRKKGGSISVANRQKYMAIAKK